MKMLKVKHRKSTCQYRLDWLAVWNLIHIKHNGKNPEEWVIVLLFVDPGYYKLSETENNGRLHHKVSFEFSTEAEAMAAVSIVDI